MSDRQASPVGTAVALRAWLEGSPDTPVLILGNSLGTSIDLWKPQLPALAGRFRLLRYEHRGHGTVGGDVSPSPTGPYSIADLGADVLAVMDRFGIRRALYCGVSLGGMIGMWLAAAAPERIAGLALCCTSAYLPPASMWRERAELVRAHGAAVIASQVVSRWFTPAFAAAAPDVPAAFVSGLAATGPEGYAGCCEAIAAMDLRAQLPMIMAPTLVMAGEQDPATPPWHGAVIAAGIAGARLKVIRGAAHLANVSNAGEVSAAVTGHFLRLAQREPGLTR
jgi:3-oxoadipate enol-lactonase